MGFVHRRAFSPKITLQHIYNQPKKIDGRPKSRSTGLSKAPGLTKLSTLQQSGTFLKNFSLTSRQDKKSNNHAAPNMFAASDTWLGWIKHSVKVKAVARIDMTYKLGPFYLTTLTCANPMFVYKNKEGRYPTTMAAIMTSVTKEERDYEYMARCLKGDVTRDNLQQRCFAQHSVNFSCYVTRVNFSCNIIQNELGNMRVTRDDFSRNVTCNILRIQATRLQAM